MFVYLKPPSPQMILHFDTVKHMNLCKQALKTYHAKDAQMLLLCQRSLCLAHPHACALYPDENVITHDKQEMSNEHSICHSFPLSLTTFNAILFFRLIYSPSLLYVAEDKFSF